VGLAGNFYHSRIVSYEKLHSEMPSAGKYVSSEKMRFRLQKEEYLVSVRSRMVDKTDNE
jgi:hypothetical protein